jgi:hypothetical protein
MDFIPSDLNLEDGLPQFLVLFFLGLVAVYLFSRLFTDPHAAVTYSVPEPEQLKPGWKGEIVSEPSLKVISFP